MHRHLTYFASDVHLGLQVSDPAGREARFVAFLKAIPAAETEALYLLGDVWDFWYEYRDVVPKGYVRVFGALTDLMDAGVKVYFFPGNHDIWTYRYFGELGIEICDDGMNFAVNIILYIDNNYMENSQKLQDIKKDHINMRPLIFFRFII